MRGQNKFTVELFQEQNGDWRRRVKAVNGKIIDTAGEGNERLSHMLKMTKKLFIEPTNVTIKVIGWDGTVKILTQEDIDNIAI